MKKPILNILFVILFCFSFKTLNAQWVTIPDSNFVVWLNANGYASCMNGNLMDTTCNAIITTDTINVGGASINNLDGIQYFDNASVFWCNNQPGTLSAKKVTNLPALPPMLRSISTAYNLYPSLPTLPDSLEKLISVDGALQLLPTLPSSLTELWFYHNGIDTIPQLPSNLTELFCWNNALTFLPPLPPLLRDLRCDNNQLVSLPALPDSLRSLNCGYNPNMAIPVLPDSLKTIDCRNNNWTSLPVLPSTLTSLTCYYNQITAFPPLPASLISLYIAYNPVSVFPVLPSNLRYLQCDSTGLTSFPAPLPPLLYSLTCGHNQLTTLPDLPSTLKNLTCNYTPLVSIPDLNDTMSNVTINNNPNLTCFPKYKKINYLAWGNTAITCLPNAGSIGTASPAITNLPLCLSVNPCGFNWSMYGKIYNDTNSNCQLDSAEALFKNLRVNLDSNGTILQSFIFNTEGYYSFKTGFGNYEIKIDTAGIPFNIVCPASGNYSSSITAIDSVDADLNFGLVCKPGFFDLIAKSISPNSLFISGMQNKLFLNAGDASLFYGITCSVGISGTVQATLSGPVSYVSPDSGSLSPSSVISNVITWNINDFSQVNPIKDFNIIVNVDTTATIFDTVCVSLSISPNTDNNPSNNVVSNCFPVQSSYDPNAKMVFPAGDIDTSQHWLTYTIFFQNTGNFPAKNIKIIDTLDTDLDALTFQYLSSSHDPVVQLQPGNILQFYFPNIYLPDSTNDEQHSHGYVQFKVKLNVGLLPGTIIKNKAHIIFDFNNPVVTNSVTNEIVNPLGTEEPEFLRSQFRILPNPIFNQQLNLISILRTTSVVNFELFDIRGRKVFSKSVFFTSNQQVITLPDIADGIYQAVIESGQKRNIQKVVILKK